MSEQAKAKGNSAFSSGDYAAAIRHFTEAIALSPTPNHVLYSNRSAAHASLGEFPAALADAQKTVKLSPYWPKGYGRLGAAHVGLKDYSAAVVAYKKGLDFDPTNEALKSGLTDAEAASRSSARGSGEGMSNPFGEIFKGQELWAKLTADPTMRGYLAQPDFVKIMQEIQKNPNSMNLYMKDHRVRKAVGVLLNVNFSAQPGRSEEAEMAEESREVKRDEEKPPQAPAAAPDESTEVEEDLGKEKERAKKEKEEGNAAYKKKDFEKAIECYTRAIELDNEDVSFLTNRAAVYLEMGRKYAIVALACVEVVEFLLYYVMTGHSVQYEDCIKDCDKAVERGRELRSDFKMVARALTRKGTALVKLAKSSKDYEPAIETFQKALTEHRNPDTLKKLYDAEKAKKVLEQQESFDPKIADEEREKGNEFFKEQKYPEAIKHYTEALKRNPNDPRVYSNRAACYTKLGALPEGLKDAEKCIELDPAFSKGYTRKGAVQFFMKEYDKALETYQEGLKHDPSNQELLDGVRRCVEQINKASRGDFTPDELKERQAKAMQDPEIQNILTDPVMRQVLVDFQENPKSAQEHTKSPMVMSKIQKLVSAGIVQIK